KTASRGLPLGRERFLDPCERRVAQWDEGRVWIELLARWELGRDSDGQRCCDDRMRGDREIARFRFGRGGVLAIRGVRTGAGRDARRRICPADQAVGSGALL